MRDTKSRVIKAISKRIGDCPVLLAECEALRQAVIMIVQMNMPRVCIQSDSLMIVNVINGKSTVPKEIINIVEDIKLLLLY